MDDAQFQDGSFMLDVDSPLESKLQVQASVNEVEFGGVSDTEESEVTAPDVDAGDRRILAEDITWGIVEQTSQEFGSGSKTTDVQSDREQISEQVLSEIGDKVEKPASFVEGEEVKDLEKEDTQLALEIPEIIIAQSASAQAVALSELGEEPILPPDDAETKLVEPVEAIEDHAPETTSQTQLSAAPPGEEKEEVTVEEKEEVIVEETDKLTAQEGSLSDVRSARSARSARFGTKASFRISAIEDLQEVELQRKKDELIEKLHAAMVRQDALRGSSQSLQIKIAEVYKKTKIEAKRDLDKKYGPSEETYTKMLGKLQKLRETVDKSYGHRLSYTNTVKERSLQKKEEVAAERKKLYSYLRKVLTGAVFTHNRKPIPLENVEHYMKALSSKESDISKIRLAIIKIKNNIDKNTMLLRSKEELDDGLHLQDFEQLKIENQTYNEKIEEKNEDMVKLKRKISSTVQILSHCKEKLHYVQHDNQEQVNNLKDAEASLITNGAPTARSVAHSMKSLAPATIPRDHSKNCTREPNDTVEELTTFRMQGRQLQHRDSHSRDVLAKLKRARDVLRTENTKLHSESGLLGNKSLLNNFESQKDKILDYNNQLQQLKIKYHVLCMKCNEMQNKISMATKE